MNQKINVLIVEMEKKLRPATVEDTLETFQQIVGGAPLRLGVTCPNG